MEAVFPWGFIGAVLASQGGERNPRWRLLLSLIQQPLGLLAWQQTQLSSVGRAVEPSSLGGGLCQNLNAAVGFIVW